MSQFDPQQHSITFHGPDIHGQGLSSSSNYAVLFEAMQSYFRNGLPIDREAVARAALRFERRNRQSGAVAANDVYPIAHGGVVEVQTEPNRSGGLSEQDGRVSVRRIACDRNWVADHVLLAFNPVGQRHNVPGLLARLFGHARAAEIVGTISGLASDACGALERCDFDSLAQAVRLYRETFDGWMNGAYLNAVRGVAEQMIQRLSIPELEYKPPGAGSTESLIILVPDRAAGARVSSFLAERHWWVQPAIVTDGVCSELLAGERGVRITAGHRIDFVGAADLGQDSRIGVAGRCCACAISPRTEILSCTFPRSGKGPIELDPDHQPRNDPEVSLRAEVTGDARLAGGRSIVVFVNPADNAHTYDAWWAQQRTVRHDNRYQCMCQFGEEHLGVGERFTIVAIATDQHFQTGEVVYGVRGIGEEIGRRTVLRTR